jgi:hypothetical protein
MADTRKDEPGREPRPTQLPAEDKDKPKIRVESDEDAARRRLGGTMTEEERRRRAALPFDERKKLEQEDDAILEKEALDRRETEGAAERARQDTVREEQQSRNRIREAHERATREGSAVRNVDVPDVCKTPMPEGEEPPPGGPLPGAPGSTYI